MREEMLPAVRAGGSEWEALLAGGGVRLTSGAGKTVEREVEALIGELRASGWDAVRRISRTFDKQEPREIPREEWSAALDSCEGEIVADLRACAANIEAYQRRLITENIALWDNADGGRVGWIARPLDRVGIYVPGGTAAYPSSVLMGVIPARAAGVREIVMATPPGGHLRPEVLAAALISGVDRVFAVGGVPAVAAMALGIDPVPRCGKIVGPGNAYVQEAKRQFFGQVDIDSLAGPSEILILCDGTANPAWIAADLLGQAEHDVLSSVMLVSMEEGLVGQVRRELEGRLADLPRQDIARRALCAHSAAIVCQTREQALETVNRFAPEHLEIMTADPEGWLPGIRNAGAVFLGAYSPEVLGDYRAGPSHVLPTYGSARFFSVLSAETFMKKISVMQYDKTALARSCPSLARLARSEGLEAHARSAEIRQTEA